MTNKPERTVLRFPNRPRIPTRPAVFNDTHYILGPEDPRYKRVQMSLQRACEATGEFQSRRLGPPAPRPPTPDERILDLEERLGLAYWLKFTALGVVATTVLAVLLATLAAW